ncbi:hypothetical protein F7734_53170 [Scytonema sp. UIC 10036]|uniref:hypothetical protein n=1 Tax=Scytonema sp. UIC 10036 TaxID=2304196 RepID=UPI0012DA716C|nr:hypothetical protein [Scytonema sp. UIC 10036]MUH00564.1 hypothetical protein [Scytonema sp. UIC 10036]
MKLSQNQNRGSRTANSENYENLTKLHLGCRLRSRNVSVRAASPTGEGESLVAVFRAADQRCTNVVAGNC